jgi:hypothetical protein
MKVSYEQIQMQLDTVFDNYQATDPQEIDGICNDAREFIEACGWSVEDFIERLICGEKRYS